MKRNLKPCAHCGKQPKYSKDMDKHYCANFKCPVCKVMFTEDEWEKRIDNYTTTTTTPAKMLIWLTENGYIKPDNK